MSNTIAASGRGMSASESIGSLQSGGGRPNSRTLVGVIDVRGLHKAFGDRVLFRDASLRIGARDRVALVGPNGSGKTTLVEMISGIQQPDTGEITVPKDAVIGYLPQET